MRRRPAPRSIELARLVAAARSAEERARLQGELESQMLAERVARHGPPDPNGEISTVKGRFPIEARVVGHVFPDGRSIDYGGPLDAPKCLLPSAHAHPPVANLQAPWVFRLSAKDDDA